MIDAQNLSELSLKSANWSHFFIDFGTLNGLKISINFDLVSVATCPNGI